MGVKKQTIAQRVRDLGDPAFTPRQRSYAPEVIADSSGKWCGNQLRFATHDEALNNVTDLMHRWTAVRDIRVVQTGDPVNCRWAYNKLIAVGETP